MSRDWIGSLFLDRSFALFVGRVGDNAAHRHQAAQIAVSDRVRGEVAGESLAGSWLAIASGARHRIVSDTTACLLYLDPMSATGRAVTQRLAGRPGRAGPTRSLPNLAVKTALTPDAARALREACLQAAGVRVAPEAPAASSVDPRIRDAIERIEARAPDGPVALEELARCAGLSPGRFGVLFRQATGTAPRAYGRWARLRSALRSISNGANATEAAVEAGFSDAAHLARTFRAMFGTTLSQSALGLEISCSE